MPNHTVAVALSIAATVGLVIVIAQLGRLRRALTRRASAAIERQLRRLPDGSVAPTATTRVIALVHRVVTAAVALLGLFVAYWWLTFVLRRFPYTRSLGESLREVFLTRAAILGERIMAATPDLIMVGLIAVIARLTVKLSNGIFDAIAAGRIQAAPVYAETAPSTKRIVAALICAFALVEAYPFLPGSGTDAFKGVSVFIGLVVSLGSTGIMNQIMSSFTLTYARALHVGDYVRLGEVEGTVTELGMLSTKLKTPRREEVTIPNTVVLADRTTNFTRYHGMEGVYVATTVTIGYDAPWRQVQALLLMAVERTPGVRRDPPPVVLQVGLEDFYVRYMVLVSLEQMDRRAATLNVLHGNVQDTFNEYGVQIMSPNYEADPDAPKTVPKERWYAAPAGAAREHRRQEKRNVEHTIPSY